MPLPISDLRFRIAILMAAFCSAVAAIYAIAGVEAPVSVSLLLIFGPTFSVILWMQKDAQAQGVGAVQDFGFFAWMAWPLVIPWYAFKSRGRGGWRLLVALFALIFAAQVTPGVIYWLDSLVWMNSRELLLLMLALILAPQVTHGLVDWLFRSF